MNGSRGVVALTISPPGYSNSSGASVLCVFFGWARERAAIHNLAGCIATELLGWRNMKSASFSRVVQFASVLLLVSSNVVSQVERASLVGTVTDSSGAVVPGVSVKVISEGTNASVNLETDAAGEYRAVNLTPGSYVVEAEKSGFQRYVTRGLVLQVAQEARLDVRLQVGGLEQTVEVNAAPPLLQTEGSTVGQVIDTKPIETLPLNGRNIVQLAV